MSAAANGNDASNRRTGHGLGPLLALIFAAVVMLATGRAAAGVVDPGLEARLAAAAPGALVPVIVELASQENAGAAASHAPGFDRHARGRAVVAALHDRAARTQPPVMAQIAQEQARGGAHGAKSLWIVNAIVVSATEPVIRRLAARDDVRDVRFDAPIPPPKPVPSAKAAATLATTGIAWNIAQIRAPDVWDLDPTYNGTGSVVGSFDTGVDGTHPDLAPRYRGDDAISWFDPYGEHASPFDADGHGTHTTGTAVGGDASGEAIGVAPGAKWIAAKGWDDNGNATVSAFHEIFQWFLAPGGDAANAPDVVNDSWGLDPPGCYPDFLPDVQAWRAAGIFPVFAAGNDGPLPATILSPGNYAEALAVGATDDTDAIADFSSRGPSQCDGEVKPDIAAPGVSILSSLPGAFWFELDGTSMATPHVTGAVAVLRSIDPTLTVDQVEAALVEGAVDLGTPGADNDYGVGRLDLLESARIVIGKPLLGIAATTPKAFEAGTVPAAFTVTREGDTTAALSVTYTVGGTATPGDDFVPLSGSVTIPAGAASATIVVNPIDDTVLEYDETVIVTLDKNPAYLVAPAHATVTIVSDELFPDLVMSALTVPSTAGAGFALTVSDTTKNQGGGAAPTTSTTTFYLSANSVLDASDVVLGSRTVAALGPGASDTGSMTLTIPAGTATGTYFIFAQADSANVVPETSDTNNTTLRAVLIGPDLGVASLTAPNTAGAGGTISITDTTKNLGAGAAPPSITRFYLSSNASLDSGDVMLGSRSVGALGPGASDTGTVTLTIPAATAGGLYYLIAKADGDDAIVETQEGNNNSVRGITLGADLVISTLTAPNAAGAGQSITVSDTTKNQGGGSAAASTTTLYLSANAALDGADLVLANRAVAPLAAGASDTGSTTVTIPAGTATGTYYIIAKTDSAGVVPETTEGNNTSVHALLIGPDLAIPVFSAPAAAGAGSAISVSDTTKNQGAGDAPATTTRYYLSSNTVLDASDTLVGSRPVAALAASASDSGAATLTIPAATAGGIYYLIAKADGEDTLAETQETNNTYVRSIAIGADLVVSTLTVPTAAGAGATITVSDVTKNQGGGTAAASTTSYYLSTDSVLDAGDAVLGSRAVAALAAGATDTGSLSVTIPAGTATGTYYVLARADAGNVVPETLETNNTNVRSLLVGPDLAISSLTAPTTAAAGGSIAVTDTTKNQGAGDAPPTSTRYYLSANTVLDASDVPLGARGVAALVAGASDTGSVTLAIPAGTTGGLYYLIAKADGDDALAETQEGNNTSLRGISIGADLVVSTLTAPTASGAGLVITVSDTTKNQGGGTAAASTTTYYLSTDSVLDAGDVVLGSRAVAALAAGAMDTGSASVTIPASTVAGTYFLFAKADSANVVGEVAETNNTTLRALLVGPDLAIPTMTVPTTVGAGLSVAVGDTTKNQGGGPAPASTTTFYLSMNSQLDASDIVLGSRAVGALAAGASDTGSVTFTIPAGTATGTYFLIARADSADGIVETSESNNTNLRSILVGPDLVVSALSGPTTASVGGTISMSDTTKNQGGGDAPATTTRYWLSSDAVLDAGDVLIGARAVAALAGGAVNTGTIALTIPAGTAAGSYYLIAESDGEHVVAETQEANNKFPRLLQVSP